MTPINAIPSLGLLPASKGVAPAANDKDGPQATFGQWLEQSLGEVNHLQQESDEAAQKLISGESKDIHGAMITMQKSSIAIELTMEVRNKIIAAYDEIKRMQF